MLCGVKDGTCETGKESVILGYRVRVKTSGRHTQCRIKQIMNEDPLNSTGKSALGGDPNRKEIHGRGDTCIRVTGSFCCT